ncbi:hypothetical protein MRB53_021465 [Persea americana]|uniref:Uncharacterized protein n=1 Tax=Persea americana TaxID=3435 RepID=A0ACC2L473_PERAE|nr:hypothetical protein MRB53_021465 [Persea americana]
MACLKSSLSLWVAAALIFFPICTSLDTITPIQSLRDGETLVSAGKKFVLGFFSPGNSKNRYVGVWYNNIPDPTIVWTANRENPVRNSSGVLTINGGNLVLVDGGHSNNSILWSTNVSIVPKSSTAALTDSGNLILRDDDQSILWQSFDYPTNTFLPGMIVRLDRAGLNRVLTSWKSEDDPATGEFSVGLNPRDMPQFFLRKGSDLIWRSGPWNGQKFGGVPSLDRSSVPYVANDDEIYYPYVSNDTSIISRSVLEDSGVFKRLMWSDKNRRWTQLWEALQDGCDRYGNCGAYGSCDANRLAECTCLRGFEPKTPRDWNLRDWSDGCVRSRPMDCGGKGDEFLKLANVKVPDTARSRVELGLSLEACKEECLKTCSCTAYANANGSGKGSGCVIWYGNLIDIKVFGDSDEGQDLYTRVAASELRGLQDKRKLLVTIFIAISVVLSFVLCGYCWWRKRKGCKMNEEHETDFNENATEENGKGSELPIFSLGVIEAATDNFSESNMLGKGGFGVVYKSNSKWRTWAMESVKDMNLRWVLERQVWFAMGQCSRNEGIKKEIIEKIIL